MTTTKILLLTALAVGVASPASAHHSRRYFYDACQSVAIEGRVERIEFKNPHTVIVLRLDDGAAYIVDWAPQWRLTTDGVIGPAKGALVFGARVAVTGSRIRTAAQMQEHFPDFKYDVNPNTLDPSSIGRVGDGFSWVMPNPPKCER